MPSTLPISSLAFGRGERQQYIEKDGIQFVSGVRFGETLGSPITMTIQNKDWVNWEKIMSIEAGDFEPVDPHETAELILRSVVVFTHPVMVAQCMQDGRDIEADARATVRFLLRAITRR